MEKCEPTSTPRALVAQSVEHCADNAGAIGSNPIRRTGEEMIHRFEDLELPEEILEPYYQDEPHITEDEDWVFEVETYCEDLVRAAGKLKDEIGYLIQQTPIIRRFRIIRKLLKEYGSHKPSCKYMSIATPRAGEEPRYCDCGWWNINMELRRLRR